MSEYEKWQEYERRKSLIVAEDHKEYEEQIKVIIEELEL